MQVWNVLIAARWKYRTQKSRQKSPSGHHRTNSTVYIFATEARIDSHLLSSNTSSTWPYNMMNFGPLVAEILSLAWGTPANFNGFRVFAALLHGTLVLSVSQTCAVLNRGRHLYLAGRPSRWALAHILVVFIFLIFVILIRLLASVSQHKSPLPSGICWSVKIEWYKWVIFSGWGSPSLQ